MGLYPMGVPSDPRTSPMGGPADVSRGVLFLMGGVMFLMGASPTNLSRNFQNVCVDRISSTTCNIIAPAIKDTNIKNIISGRTSTERQLIISKGVLYLMGGVMFLMSAPPTNLSRNFQNVCVDRISSTTCIIIAPAIKDTNIKNMISGRTSTERLPIILCV